MIRTTTLILVIVTLALSSCRNDEQAALTVEREQTLASLQPITYRRAGGAGTQEERIEISREGDVRTRARSGGNVTGRISEFQLMQLARMFDGWERLRDIYSSPAGQPQATTEIQFGAKKVVVNDGAVDVPDQFRLVRERLEVLAQEIRRGK